ncbi:MAG TPA: hypothetical protein VFB54_13300 [Burkholderiales bacterium]|nr:hypothetical protein [Burkholderiales bacterium]
MRTCEDNRFDGKGFYRAVALVVEARGVSWRSVASATGITPSSLSRFAQGSSLDSASLAKLSAWSGLNPADFVVPMEGAASKALESIAAVLREDPNLDAQAARTLEAIIRTAYQTLRQSATPKAAGKARRPPRRHVLELGDAEAGS